MTVRTQRSMTTVQQHPATLGAARLTLILPLAEEFGLYGGADVIERPRAWALDGRYLLAAGVPHCAHGLYLLSLCPGLGCYSRYHGSFLDHVNLWVPASPPERPFLLAHPYARTVSPQAIAYAEAHGLELTADFPGDDWYGAGMLPLRLAVLRDFPMWSIGAEAAAVVSACPIEWPVS